MKLFDKIVVFSGGKTGSMTLYNTFKKYNINSYHIHGCNGIKINPNDTFFEFYDGPYYHPVTVSHNKDLLIISSYREPVSRMISSLFHSYTLFVPEININDSIEINFEKIKNKLFDFMINKYYFELYHPTIQLRDLNFFDIYSRDFDKINGHSIYNFKNVTFIMLRFDKLKEWESIIAKYLNFPNFKIYPDNVTENKVYAKLYRYTLANLVIPVEYAKDLLMADINNLRFFYEEKDVRKIFEKYNVPYPESI